ncbi:MAG: SDR family NAD(P)-dependent oxidoreductase, partial [Vicinamibacterales bacterium]|nr:SDR family NAD(P)-dependent oxidoreductase [Vicinamibacterales bacterium]
MNRPGHDTAPGRLRDRTIILTGAGGSVGQAIARVVLREGARLVLTSRSRDNLEATVTALAAEGAGANRVLAVAADLADPAECERVVTAAATQFGDPDALVNNADTSGPLQPLDRIPFTAADLASLERGGATSATSGGGAAVAVAALPHTDTMFDAAAQLLTGPWHMTRASLPRLVVGGAIVNVVPVLSRMPFYGGIPYVVPTAALTALSQGLARELGRSDRAVRVNTVLAGPAESERLRAVFETADRLKGSEPGATAAAFLDTLRLRRPGPGGEAPRLVYPSPADVAGAVVWLVSPEAAACAGATLEVTHGLDVAGEARAELVSWPDMRLVDLTGRVILIVAGEDIDEALAYANAHLERGAQVVLAFRQLEVLERARLRAVERASRPLHLLQADPLRRESVARASRFLADRYGRLDAVLVLPSARPGTWGRSLAMAGDDLVRRFVADEVVAPVAIASALSGELHRVQRALKDAPAITFVTNRDDGAGNVFAEVARAGVEELLRVWRHEESHDVAQRHRRFAVAPNLEGCPAAGFGAGEGGGQLCTQLILEQVAPLAGTARLAAGLAARVLAAACATLLRGRTFGGRRRAARFRNVRAAGVKRYVLCLAGCPTFRPVGRGDLEPVAVVHLALDDQRVALAGETHTIVVGARSTADVERFDLDNSERLRQQLLLRTLCRCAFFCRGH